MTRRKRAKDIFAAMWWEKRGRTVSGETLRADRSPFAENQPRVARDGRQSGAAPAHVTTSEWLTTFKGQIVALVPRLNMRWHASLEMSEAVWLRELPGCVYHWVAAVECRKSERVGRKAWLLAAKPLIGWLRAIGADVNPHAHLLFSLTSPSPPANSRSFLLHRRLSFFFPTTMKCSIAAALLAIASVSAHEVHHARHLHLAQRQNPSSVGSSVSSSSSLSSGTSSISGSPVASSPIPTTTSQVPPSTITGGPGALPINQIISGMSSGTPILPTTTYSPGSRPTWSGAPPLPSACTSCPRLCYSHCPYTSSQSPSRRRTGLPRIKSLTHVWWSHYPTLRIR